MRRTLHFHVLRANAPLGTAPTRGEAFEVEALSVDRLRERGKDELIRRGYRIRVVSFSPGGMVAYVEVAS